MRLKELRLKNRVSQIEIAKFLNVSQKTYSNYELGITEPSIETLIEIANYFCVTIDYLVERPFSNEFGYLNDEEKEIVSAYREMKPSNKNLLLSEAKVILKTQK